jgi:hypothetical protein
MWGEMGDKNISYPFFPYVVSNRLYLYAQIPFMSGMQRIVMNDTFDSALPLPWDRNYGTNGFAYEIVNENKNPVLQVGYFKPNEIHINGIFIENTNSVLKAFGDMPQLIGMEFKIVDLETNQIITNLNIVRQITLSGQTNSIGEIITNAFYDMTFQNQSPIFKYPSGSRNIGVYAVKN